MFFYLIWFNRVKNRADIIGAFKVDPLYLKHENQESGKKKKFTSTHFEITITYNISPRTLINPGVYNFDNN